MNDVPPGNGSDEHPPGELPDRTRSVRGVAIVVVAVVIGVLLLPSATRAPLAAEASTAATTSTTVAPTAGAKSHHTAAATTTTVAPASVHVLVANATTTNGVAGDVTRYLGSKGFSSLPATNALVKVNASQIFTVGGATADVQAVAAALGLPATSIEPAASSAPVSSTAGANVVVIVGPDLASRYGPGAATTTSQPG